MSLTPFVLAGFLGILPPDSPELTLRIDRDQSTLVPYYRQDSDESISLESANFLLAAHANRWYLSGTISRTTGYRVTQYAVESRITPLTLGALRPGIGYRWRHLGATHTIFASGGSSILGTHRNDAFTGVVDLGFGGYDRSRIRLIGTYGIARMSADLGLAINDEYINSPIDRDFGIRAAFAGTGLETTVRFSGISLEASAVAYRATAANIVIPDGFLLTNVSLTYVSPLKIGIHIRASHISKVPIAAKSSLQTVSDGVVIGITARIP